MSENKCFCHLNGFEVKDAQARADIADINGTIGIWPDKTKTLAGEALAHRTALVELNEDVTAVDERVTALENSGVGADVLERVTAVETRVAAAAESAADAEESIADHEPRITALEGKKLYHHKTNYIGILFTVDSVQYTLQLRFNYYSYATSALDVKTLLQRGLYDAYVGDSEGRYMCNIYSPAGSYAYVQFYKNGNQLQGNFNYPNISPYLDVMEV